MVCCCCPHAKSAGKLFSFFAHRYRKRFERRGFEPSQKQLVTGLEQAGFQGASLLEIGSGVGYLHQTLLERGAASAVGIDLAGKMLNEAAARAQEHGLASRTRYLQGDFVTMAESLEPADVTILDKVICCYPDADAMVNRSLARTRRVYAITIPRDRWFFRMALGLVVLILKAVRSDFRPYIHDPAKIEKWITGAGFTKHYEGTTPIWLTQVYTRR
jgi:2-polyprenyl-3-methyl-5-hydroxy-6-metoxy-1,4-benzoquinol methylase